MYIMNVPTAWRRRFIGFLLQALMLGSLVFDCEVMRLLAGFLGIWTQLAKELNATKARLCALIPTTLPHNRQPGRVSKLTGVTSQPALITPAPVSGAV